MSLFKTTSTEPDTAWLLRVNGANGRRWIIYDETKSMKGKPNESRKALIKRWIEAHGTFKHLVRYKGICRTAEAVMCMTQDQIHTDD